MAGPLAGAAGAGLQDRPAPPALHGGRRAGLRAHRRPLSTRPPAAIRQATRIATLASALVFLVVFTAGHPSRLFETGPFTSDFMDVQAHYLLKGSLAVDPEVAGFEGFTHDGKTYFYFGLAPAVARIPLVAFTDDLDGRLVGVSLVTALALACWASGRLAWFGRLATRGDGPPTPGEPLAAGFLVAAVGLSSPLLFLAARPIVYHEAAAWGAATALLAAVAVLRWWHQPTTRTLVLASAAATVAVQSRGSQGFGAMVALGLAMAAGWGRLPERRRLLVAAAALLVPLASYSLINFLRFESALSVPVASQTGSAVSVNREAALEANDGSLFGPQFVPTNLWNYLRPDGIRLQPLYPWLTFREGTTLIGDPVYDTTDRATSLTAGAPVILGLSAVGAVVAIRRRRLEWLALAAGGVVTGLFVIAFGFIANRYLVDSLLLLVPLAALGLWPAAARLRGGRPHALLSRSLAVAALVLGLLVNAALANQSQSLLLVADPERRADYVDLQYRLDLRNGPAPEVRAAGDELGDVGERGDIAILADCAGVYWSDGAEWFALEVGSPWALVATGSPATRRRPILTTANWRLDAERDGDEVTITYADWSRRTEATVDWPADAGDLEVTVVRDPEAGNLSVLVDGEVVLFQPFIFVVPTVRIGRLWTRSPVPTPRCEALTPRIDQATGRRAGSRS